MKIVTNYMRILMSIFVTVLSYNLQAEIQESIGKKAPVNATGTSTASSKAKNDPVKNESSGLSLEQINQWYQTLHSSFQEYLSPALKSQYNNNPFKYQSATISSSSKITDLEQQFLRNRERKGGAALAEFFQQYRPISATNKNIKVGFCGTGGGYRAMILTLGYLAALERTKLMDMVTHISSLSGSTWFLAPWIMSDDTIDAYRKRLIAHTATGLLELTPEIIGRSDFDLKAFIDQVLWPKFLFNQSLSVIDWYGALLSYVLFYAKKPAERFSLHVSQQRDWIAGGQKPFPIYTMVSMHNLAEGSYLYNWYEVNPFEVRNLDLNLSLPSFAFGSQFLGGKSVEIAPEQSLGFLLGIFGSAVSVNMKDIIRIMSYRTEIEMQKMSGTERIKYGAIKQILAIIEQNINSFTTKARVFAAQLFNPFKGLLGTASWLQARDELTFVDGGIDYNIPLKPLLRPERHLDLIIIGESSAGADTLRELTKALDDAKKTYGYNYTRIDDGKNTTLHFYKDLGNAAAPRLVYVTFTRDAWLMSQQSSHKDLISLVHDNDLGNFDVAACIAGQFCGTSNFKYSSQQIKQLSGMAEYNMLANQPSIAHFIAEEFFKEKDSFEDESWEIGR